MARKKNRQPSKIPEDESKADRFKRVVSPRVVKAVKAIRVIGYCSGVAYEHTSEQVEQIVGALQAALTNLESSYAAKAEKQEGFTFTE